MFWGLISEEKNISRVSTQHSVDEHQQSLRVTGGQVARCQVTGGTKKIEHQQSPRVAQQSCLVQTTPWSWLEHWPSKAFLEENEIWKRKNCSQSWRPVAGPCSIIYLTIAARVAINTSTPEKKRKTLTTDKPYPQHCHTFSQTIVISTTIVLFTTLSETIHNISKKNTCLVQYTFLHFCILFDKPAPWRIWLLGEKRRSLQEQGLIGRNLI